MMCQSRAAEPALKISGLLKEYNETNLTETYNFTMLQSDCRWLIHTEPKTDAHGLLYYEDSYDGTNVYSYLQFAGTPGKNVINSSGAVVEKNDIPNNNAVEATAIWLAYGSACYFDKVKDDMVKPFFDWFEPNPTELNTLVKMDLKRSDAPPFLPTFIYSKNINRRYRVINVTNIAGLTIPSEFVVECFNPRSQIATNIPGWSFHGFLTAVASVPEELSAQNFRPSLDGKAYTVDRRFPDKTTVASALTYVNTNSRWLSTNNSKLLTIYHNAMISDPPETVLAQPSHAFVLLLLICPTFIFAIAVIFSRWRRRLLNNEGSKN